MEQGENGDDSMREIIWNRGRMGMTPWGRLSGAGGKWGWLHERDYMEQGENGDDSMREIIWSRGKMEWLT